MDLEELNKSQIVLLTILVSFVTSIATGIVTASLIERAPADVTRIMQRVVEKVAPATSQQATVVTREKTVVIKEADLISAAIAKDESKIISVVTTKDKKFISLGVFINKKGVVAMDASTLKKAKDTSYSVKVGKDTYVKAKVTYPGGAHGVALLTIMDSVYDAKTKIKSIIKIRPVTYSDTPLHLGQTVVSFIGEGSIAQGITSKLGDGGYIMTSINPGKIAPGAILINVNGDVAGISTGASRKINKSTFAPIRTAIAIDSSPKGIVSDSAKGDTSVSTTTTSTTTKKETTPTVSDNKK